MFFTPPRLLSVNIQNVAPYANWNGGAMGPGDPWTAAPYQWTVRMGVVTQTHSSPFSTNGYFYDGRDIAVGDWVSDVFQGRSVKVVSITSASFSTVTCVVEDVDRFNTFADPSGNGGGVFNNGLAFVFTLNEDGLPILSPMTSVATTLAQNLAWQQDQMSRFAYRNYIRSFYRVNQPGHSFVVGDVLSLTGNGSYAKVSSTSPGTPAIVGHVNSTSTPGPAWFTYRPAGRVVTGLSPALPGQPGDFIYAGASGLTNVSPGPAAQPLYIQLETNTSGLAISPSYSRVDAQSFEIIVTPSSATTPVSLTAGGSAPGVLMGNVSANRSVTSVTVNVTSAFAAAAVITVGTAADVAVLMPAAFVDLTAVGAYVYTPGTEFAAPYTPLYSFVAMNGSTTGSATIIVTYV